MSVQLFSIHCPTCNARLRVRDAAAIGRILACPKCASMVEVQPPDDWQPDTPTVPPNEPVASDQDVSSEQDPAESPPRDAGQAAEEFDWATAGERNWQRRIVLWSLPVIAMLIAVAAGLRYSSTGPADELSDEPAQFAKQNANDTEKPPATLPQADEIEDSNDPPLVPLDDAPVEPPGSDEIKQPEPTATTENGDASHQSTVPLPEEPLAGDHEMPTSEPLRSNPTAGTDDSPDTTEPPTTSPDPGSEPSSDPAEASPEPATQRTPQPPSEQAIAAVRRRLSQRVRQVEIDQIALTAVVEFVARMTTLEIQWDQQALDELGIETSVPVSLELQNPTAAEILTKVLSEHQLVYKIVANGLLITSGE